MKTKTTRKIGFALAVIGIAVGLFLSSAPRKPSATDTTPSTVNGSKKADPNTNGAPTISPPSAPSSTQTGNSSASNTAKDAQSSSLIITNDSGKVISEAKVANVNATVTGKTPDGASIVVVQTGAGTPLIQGIIGSNDATLATNHRYIPAASASDPYYNAQWALNNVQANNAWDITTGSSDVVLAVIDSGILFSQTINGTTFTQPDFPVHRQFTNNGEQGTTQPGDACWTGSAASKHTNNCDDDNNGYPDDIHGWDFIGGYRGNSAACPNYSSPSTYQSINEASFITADNDPQPYSCDSPINKNVLNKDHFDGTCTLFVSACTVSHGTSVASVAAAEANNGNLISGLDHEVSLMNLRVFDGYGYTDSARIASAITYATDNGADVINMSLSYTTCDGSFVDNTIEAAVAAAKAAGVTVVAASGNNAASNVCYPASSSHVIAVGASAEDDNIASFSSYGSQLEVVAPGETVLAAVAPSAYTNTHLAHVSGTSFSAPYVAALATLLKAQHPTASPNDIQNWITQRADIVPGMSNMSRTNKFGNGRINAHVSLRVAAGDTPLYLLNAPQTSGGRDSIWTDDISERNSLLGDNKFTYSGIVSWASDTDFDGGTGAYRAQQSNQ